MINKKILSRTLAVLVLLVGLSSVVGGYGLIFTDWFKIPPASIQPFNSFVLPGLILGFVVGGTNILAGAYLWRQSKYAIEAAAVAGFGLLIWMFTEVYIMSSNTHPVQIPYFAAGIAILILALLLLKHNTRNERKEIT